MVACTSFQADCNVKSATGGYGTADSRHGDRGDVVKGNICGWLRHKNESLVKAVEMAFAGFDGAFYSGLLVMAVTGA